MIPEKPCISPGAYIAEESVIVGDVTVGNESSVFYYSVLRGDHAQIRVGSGTNIQEHCTIHVDEDYPAVIGDGVTVGHHCIIHGCQIGNDTLIGMGSIIMNGARIGSNCLIGAGSLVTQNTVVPDGMLVLGSPAKIRRPLTEEERKEILKSRDDYIASARRLFGD